MSAWKVKDVLAWASVDFEKKGIERPRFEAEVLLAAVLRCRRLDLYTGFDRPLEDHELAKFKEHILRRRSGEPTAYITGSREFWSLDFEVNPSVLVPRPETELLVEAVLDRWSEGPVWDVCTGSGCIAVALAHERPDLEVWASDVSAAASEVALRNAARHHVLDRLHIEAGDLLAAFSEPERFAVIVSNPPYVREDELAGLAAEVKKEPVGALVSGSDGLDHIRRLLSGAPARLRPGGFLILELDPRQADRVSETIGPSAFGTRGTILQDLSGSSRAVVFRAK